VDYRASGDAVDYREFEPRLIDCAARSLVNIPTHALPAKPHVILA